MGRVINITSGEPYDVYIGRPNRRYGLGGSVWANPYRVGPDGDRSEVLGKYRHYLIHERPDLLERLEE